MYVLTPETITNESVKFATRKYIPKMVFFKRARDRVIKERMFPKSPNKTTNGKVSSVKVCIASFITFIFKQILYFKCVFSA